MAKTIILIHGRDFKPSKEPLEALWLEALESGLRRDFPAKLAALGAARKELVYYGDHSNELLSGLGFRFDEAADLADRRASLDQLKTLRREDFVRGNYEALPGKRAWKEALADSFSGIFSFVGLSQPLIERIAPDMREYWNEESAFGSEVRFPMIEPLKRAMRDGDEILVIAHSLGTMIAYDTFWKFCRTGEYRPNAIDPTDYPSKKVHLWVTLGSPLTDATVQKKLKGSGVDAGHERRYPCNVIDWVNVAAEDDFISHDGTAADDFAKMKKLGLLRSLRDVPVYNLAVRHGKSNPHNEVGYLMTPQVVDVIANWL